MQALPRSHGTPTRFALAVLALSAGVTLTISGPAANLVPAGIPADLSLAAGQPPALSLGGPINDACSGAVRIPSCGPFPYSTQVLVSGATPDGDPRPTCAAGAEGGLWYVFTPGSTAEYRISACGSPELCPASIVAVILSTNGVCPQRSQIACNRQDPSTATVSLAAETTYYIVVYRITPAIPPGASLLNLSVTMLPDAVLPNGGFESGDFTGWQFDEANADVAIVPKDPPSSCFQPEMPSEGCYMACMSTGNFFGGNANHEVRSDLTSEAINFSLRPGRIEVSFYVDFQTKETERSIAFNDAFQARLVTDAGTFTIIQIDSFGRTPDGAGLTVRCPTRQLADRACSSAFKPVLDGCPLDPGVRTGRMKVTWKKTLDLASRTAIGSGPVFVEFSVSNQGNAENASIACIDDVRVQARRVP